jgi:parallel beta-helix repeat protein
VTITTAPGYPRATLRGYVYTKPGADYLTFDNLAFDGSAFTGGISIQIFGDHNTVSNSDISNGHMGESCVIVGEYEGADAHAVTGAVIDGNRIHDCGKASDGQHDHGIYLASSRDARVTNNVIYGNAGGWGIQLWADAHGSLVADNVVDGNAAGNIIIAGATYSNLGASSNNTIRDNILTLPLSGLNVEPYWDGPPGTNNVLVGNCFWGATANAAAGGNGYTETGSIVADPLYRDRASHDYTLQSGSPCAGKGPSSSTTGMSTSAAAPAATTTTITTSAAPAATTTTPSAAPASTTPATTTTSTTPATTTVAPTRTTTTPEHHHRTATAQTSIPASTTPATTTATTTTTPPTMTPPATAPATTTTPAPTTATTEATDSERISEARGHVQQQILSWRQHGRPWRWIKRQPAAVAYYGPLGGS